MKKLNTLLAILALLTIFSCSERNKNCVLLLEPNTSISPVKITLGKGSDIYTAEMRSENLVFSFEATQSAYYLLKVGDHTTEIFLSPGDSVFVPSDFRNINNPFSGTAALLNNYIINGQSFIEEIEAKINFDSIFSLPPLEFINSINSLYNHRNNRLEEFISTNNINDEVFITTEHRRIFYSSAIDKNHYYRDHKFFTGELAVLDANFDSYLNQVNFNDSDIIHLISYRDFLYTYFERVGLQQKDRITKDTLFTEIAFEDALNTINNPITKSYALYRIMDIHLNEAPINKLGKLINDFNENCFNEKYKERINKYYLKIEKLKFGKPAPNFALPDKNGKMVSLMDFEGKLIYIDVWNSYCSPCIKEFPVLEQLMEKYNGQDIVFIGISFDSDELLWKKTIEKKNLKGLQLFANGWNSQFGKDYLVYSNPRFILVDRNGNFIEAKAPKPSEHIDKIIDRYLQ